MNPYCQINSSPSKALYSFSKSSRPSLANKTYCDTFYQIPQTKNKRKAGIGYGRKTDWDQLNKSKRDVPPPNSYYLGDFVTLNKGSRKGYTAGIGRQQTKSQSFVQFDKSVPGPQKYIIQSQKQGPKYSLRPKTASENFVKNSSKAIPGPGCYDQVSSINPEGRYCVSKWQSSKAQRFSPIKSARFAETNSQAPGPGDYTPRNSMWQNNGSMTESKYISNGNRVFPTGNRRTLFDDQPKKFKGNPGPGMYDSFSDFGNLNVMSRKRPCSSTGYKKQ